MALFGLFGRKEGDRDEVLPLFKDLFLLIQQGVSENNQKILRDNCSLEMFDFFMQCKADNIRNNVKNIIENISVENIFTLDTWLDEDMNQDFHSVRIQFHMVDYYINKDEIVEGTKDSQFIEETWVFTRTSGKNNWVLASIEDDEENY